MSQYLFIPRCPVRDVLDMPLFVTLAGPHSIKSEDNTRHGNRAAAPHSLIHRCYGSSAPPHQPYLWAHPAAKVALTMCALPPTKTLYISRSS